MQLEAVSQRALQHAKKQGADQAEIGLHREQGFSVTARAGAVENLEHNRQTSFSVTVYKDKKTGAASGTQLTDEAVANAVDRALSIAGYGEPDPCAGLADADRMAQTLTDLDLFHPWGLTPEGAVALAVECDTQARAVDPRFTTAEGSYVESHRYEQLYANSHGFVGSMPTTRHSMGCHLLVKDGDDMQRGGDYTISRDPDALWSIETLVKRATEETLSRLGARRLTTRECPVIFRADVAKSLFAHFIGAISGGALYRKASFLLDALGDTIFPDFVTLSQRPHLKGALRSAMFDTEGVATQARNYVEKGVLKSYVLGSYAARKLGLASTGNAGGIYNSFVTHSDASFELLLNKMGTGLLVTELLGQGVNILTGEYSRGAFGFWVENGKVQYPVQEITIAGNLRDMFQKIRAIGNDVDERGNICTGSVLMDKIMVAGS